MYNDALDPPRQKNDCGSQFSGGWAFDISDYAMYLPNIKHTVVTTEEEVGRLFSKYGNVIKVYKELAPQVQGHPRYLCSLCDSTERRDCEKIFHIFRMWKSGAERIPCSLWYWGCHPDATGAKWGDTSLISVWRVVAVVAAATHRRSTL